MANNNFRQFDGGISIKGTYSSDPLQGQVGDIYFNTATKSLRYCFSEIPLQWRDMVISAGTTEGSVLRWDSGASSWAENPTIITDSYSINGADDNIADGVKAPTTLLSGSSKVNPASTGAGGDINIVAGTSVASNQGLVRITGDTIYLDIGHASDPSGVSAGQVYYNTTTNKFLYFDGSVWKALGGGEGGIIKTTFIDPVSTTLPSIEPLTIDGELLSSGDKVLFTNLSNAPDNNKIWEATFDGLGNITWTADARFPAGESPSESDQVIVVKGIGFRQQVGTFDGANWSFNLYTRHFNGLDYWEQSALVTSLLADNTTNGTLFGVIASGSENLIVDYSVIRGIDKSVGTLHITCVGSNVSLADSGTDIGSTGVTFGATVSGGSIIIQYTTTSTGFAATCKYSVKRWSDGAGGPANVPSYSGAYSGLTAAGSDSQVQFNDGGNFGADAGLTFDKTSKNLGIGGHVITQLNTLAIANNQSTPTTIISINKTAYPHLVISYSIDRGGETEVGRLLIATNGTDIGVSTDAVATNLGVGVSLNALIVGSNIEIQYTSDNSGFAGTLKFFNNQWN